MTNRDTASDDRYGGYFTIDNTVVDDYDLTPHEGWLYVVIVRHINKQSGIAFPSIATLAEKSGMSKRKVSDGIKALEAKGLLKILRRIRKGSKERLPNHYSLPNPNRKATNAPDAPPTANHTIPMEPDAIGVWHDVPSNNTNIKKPKGKTLTEKDEDGRTPIHAQATVIDCSPRPRQETISQFHKKFCEILGLFWNRTNQNATRADAYALFNDGWTIQDLEYTRRFCDEGHWHKDIKRWQVKAVIGSARAHYEQSAAPKQSQFGDLKGVYDHLYQQEAAR